MNNDDVIQNLRGDTGNEAVCLCRCAGDVDVVVLVVANGESNDGLVGTYTTRVRGRVMSCEMMDLCCEEGVS